MNSADGNRVAETGLEFFLRSVGYPERAPRGAVSFSMRVDGMEVLAEEMDGRIVLSMELSGGTSILPTLASYAAGRMLKEDAVLAYGDVGVAENYQAAKPSNRQAFIWQDAPVDSGTAGMVGLFETFLNSCEWWRERIDASGADVAHAPVRDDTVMIRP